MFRSQNQPFIPGVEDRRRNLQIDAEDWPFGRATGCGLIGQGGAVEMNPARSYVFGFEHKIPNLFLDTQVPFAEVGIGEVLPWPLPEDYVCGWIAEGNRG